MVPSMEMLIEKPVAVARDHFLLRFATESNALPGQFVNVRIGRMMDPLLRRPFSIHDYNAGTIEIIIRVVGKGTAWLRDNAVSGEIDILPPMGKSFTLLNKGKALLVGGGVGNAPLYYLARELKARGVLVEYVFGAKEENCIFLKEKYKAIADVFHAITDDGSCGEKGLATDCVRTLPISEYDAVYTCGPVPMMASLVEIFRKTHARIEVSVENYFGCGVGLCSGCVIETNAGNRRACIDGPVFDGRDVIWRREDLLPPARSS